MSLEKIVWVNSKNTVFALLFHFKNLYKNIQGKRLANFADIYKYKGNFVYKWINEKKINVF